MDIYKQSVSKCLHLRSFSDWTLEIKKYEFYINSMTSSSFQMNVKLMLYFFKLISPFSKKSWYI